MDSDASGRVGDVPDAPGVPKAPSAPKLDAAANEEVRQAALEQKLAALRLRLTRRGPGEVARLAALSLVVTPEGKPALQGELWGVPYRIIWPELRVMAAAPDATEAPLRTQAAWLHYLDRADGHPLAGRWVNLREIGGVFYQDAFQGYAGDELALAWGSDVEGLAARCRKLGGWPVRDLADMAFEWSVLPRLPVCVCYRAPSAGGGAWATVLFDASAGHYVAADVAAILGKELVELLKPPQGSCTG